MTTKTKKTNNTSINLVSTVEIDGQVVVTVTTTASNSPFENARTIEQINSKDLYNANRAAVKAELVTIRDLHETECFNLPEPTVTDNPKETATAE